MIPACGPKLQLPESWKEIANTSTNTYKEFSCTPQGNIISFTHVNRP
jgi:hypothetical protein